MKSSADLPQQPPREPRIPSVSGLPAARERAISLLSEGFAHNILELEEFERRVEKAHGAKSLQELEELIADLPSDLGESARPARLVTERYPEQSVYGILSTRRCKGDMLNADRIYSYCLMSTVVFDFRGVRLPPQITDIQVYALMSTVKIIVPEDLPVQIETVPLLGNCSEDRRVKNRLIAGLPGLRITGLVVMGEVKVRVR